MSNLRGLLGNATTDIAGVSSGGIGRLLQGETYYYAPTQCSQCDQYDDYLPTFYGAAGAGSSVTSCPGSVCPCGGIPAYNSYFYCCWRVPGSPTGTGTTVVTFELWGGGGGGAGVCCCGLAVPAGSGSYARKTLTGIASGTAFDLFIAPSTCRCHLACNEFRPYEGGMGCIGPRGCKTYVVQITNLTGVALTNFCAEGGLGGVAKCWGGDGGGRADQGRWCGQICDFRTLLHTAHDQAICDGFGGTAGVVGLNTSCIGCCAMFYGADYGAPGVPGAFMMNCYHYWHHNKAWIPYPGGLVNEQGGWIIYGLYGQCTTCGYCSQCSAAMRLGFGGSTYCGGGSPVPGLGAGPTTSNGGSCCCGSSGYPGAIRITVNWI